MTVRTAIGQIGRLVRSTPEAFAGRRLFFVHMPKCGGMSVAEAVETLCRRNGWAYHSLESEASRRTAAAKGMDLFDYRQLLLEYYLSSRNFRYLGGHFGFSTEVADRFADGWDFVTLLREPVDRFFSNYFFNRSLSKDQSGFAHDKELVPFLDSPEAVMHGNMYVRNLTAGSKHRGNTKAALEALERFTLIGLLEDLPSFEARFSERYRVPLKLGKKNANPVPRAQRQREISPEIVARVTELCAPDLAVYRRAQELLQGRE